jgi:hypothetical protein
MFKSKFEFDADIGEKDSFRSGTIYIRHLLLIMVNTAI